MPAGIERRKGQEGDRAAEREELEGRRVKCMRSTRCKWRPGGGMKCEARRRRGMREKRRREKREG